MRPRSRRNPDPSERLRRVRALPADRSAAESLLAAVGDPSLDVAREALRRLAPIAGPPELARLRELMLNHDVGIVADVAAALRRLGDRAAVEVALNGLAAAAPSTRQKAVLALRELRAPAARGALEAALEDPAAPVRRLALEALARLPRVARTALACRGLLDDPDPSVQAAAVAAVAALDDAAAATLGHLVAHPEPLVRQAVAAVAPLLDDDAVAALLGDLEPDVRVAALEAVGRQPRTEQVPKLVAALADPIWHVRRAAADALGASGIDETPPELLRALADSHPLVRGRASIALERLAGEEHDRLLASALAGAPAHLRRAIVEILGDRGCIEPLLQLVHDDDVDVRIAVVHALGRVASPATATALEQLASDPSLAVRNAVAVVLEERRKP